MLTLVMKYCISVILFQLTVVSSLCWEQAFPNNTVFIDTRGAGHVQMGYLSQVFDDYPNIYPSGQQVITPELLQKKCDALGRGICSAVQFFHCPVVVFDNLSLDWGNFLTHDEWIKSRKTGAVLPEGGEVTGYAYKRVRCPTNANARLRGGEEDEEEV